MSVGVASHRTSTRGAISRLLGPYRARISAVALTSFAAGLLEAAFLVIVTRGILAIADGAATVDLGFGSDANLTISESAVVAAILLATRLLAGLLAIRLQTTLFHRMLLSLRRRLGAAFLNASWPIQQKQSRGTLQHLVVQFPASIVSLGYQLVQALVGALSLLALVAVAFVIQPVTAVIVLVVVLVLGSVLWPVRQAVRRRAQQALVRQNAFAARVAEIDDLSFEIASLGVRDEADAVLDRAIHSEAISQERVALARDIVAPIYTTLAYAAILVALVVLNERGADDLDAVGAVLLIMLRSLGYGQQMQHGSSALGQMAPVVDELDARIAEFEHSRDDDGRTTISSIGTITFEHVSFAYDDREPALLDVSTAFDAGEIVGIVGSSGAGKSTLLHLLLGLRQPTSGKVSIDGVDLIDVSRESWRRLVAVVPQETRLLDGSLADNVRFWRADVADDDIERALAQAGLVLDSARFPRGIDTDLGAAGREFSGGQRQRLAIARALAAHPALVVLDEPTSSLDAESEEAIVDTLARLRGQVTVIVVSHRESTLAVCDRVLSLDGGRLSERR